MPHKPSKIKKKAARAHLDVDDLPLDADKWLLTRRGRRKFNKKTVNGKKYLFDEFYED